MQPNKLPTVSAGKTPTTSASSPFRLFIAKEMPVALSNKPSGGLHAGKRACSLPKVYFIAALEVIFPQQLLTENTVWPDFRMHYHMWKYLLIFLGSMICDISPIPLPPAFTVMIFFQIKYHLNIWYVIYTGVAGSVVGRYTLTLYFPKVAERIFKPGKNDDVQFLGKKLSEKGWRSQLFVLLYTLLPVPSTPLFIGAGIARLHPITIIPAFSIGKFTSDTIMVLIGKYAEENTRDLLRGLVSWKSIAGLIAGLLLIAVILFIDWRTLIEKKKFHLTFNIWRRRGKNLKKQKPEPG